MVHFSTLLTASIALTSSALALSIPLDAKYVVHEKREAHREAFSFAKRDVLGSNAIIPIRIGLTQRDLHLGYDWLMSVAHPESPSYGKHWSAAEVNRAFAPTAETVTAVRDWLIRAGIEESRITVADNKGWLAFDAEVKEAEELFRARYYIHEAGRSGEKYSVGCDEYSLPEHITAHIDYISPGVKHGVYKRSSGPALTKRDIEGTAIAPPPPSPGLPDVSIDVKTIPQNCSSYVVDGNCIRALYNMPAQNSNRKVNPNNALGIYEGGENYDKADLKLWIENYAPYIPVATIPEMSEVDGGEGPVAEKNAGVEALLDITIAYELIYPQVVEVFSVDDTYYSTEDAAAVGFMDTFLDAIDGSFCTYSAFGQKGDNNTIDPVYPDPHAGGYKGPLECGQFTAPNVISVSYTEGEQYLPVNYVERQCNEWMKLGLQGTTAVFASGDHGVSFYPGAYNNTNGCLNDASGNPTIFSPASWNDCPYVLSVGATTIRANVSGYSANPEMAVYQHYTAPTIPYTSGAGFSNVFARPEYQDAAVSNWFDNYDPGYPTYSTTKGKNIGANGGLYNRAGRAYPDVAANGAWTHLYADGTLIREGGTSMAAPLVASIINLLNEERLAAGKATVGFVNPTFYGNPQAFHDITIGANQGCGLTFAFNCTPGWDPVTGLGTPNYSVLKEVFMQLP